MIFSQVLPPAYALLFASPPSALRESIAVIRPVVSSRDPRLTMTRGNDINTLVADGGRKPHPLHSSSNNIDNTYFHGIGLGERFPEFDRDLERIFRAIDRMTRVDVPMKFESASHDTVNTEDKRTDTKSNDIESQDLPKDKSPPGPFSWQSSYSYSSSSDGRVVSKRVSVDSTGRRKEEEIRSLRDGDRIISKKVDSDYGVPAPEAIEGSSSPSATPSQSSSSDSDIPLVTEHKKHVTIEGAHDEDEFDALWNKRKLELKARREKAIQEQELRERKLVLRQAEIEANAIAQRAEDLRKQAQEAEDAATKAKEAYQALIKDSKTEGLESTV